MTTVISSPSTNSPQPYTADPCHRSHQEHKPSSPTTTGANSERPRPTHSPSPNHHTHTRTRRTSTHRTTQRFPRRWHRRHTIIHIRPHRQARNHTSRQRTRTIRPRLRTNHQPTHRARGHPQQGTTTQTHNHPHPSHHHTTRRRLQILRTSRHMDRTNQEQPHVPHMQRAHPPHTDATQHHPRTTTHHTRRPTTPRPTHHHTRNQPSTPRK